MFGWPGCCCEQDTGTITKPCCVDPIPDVLYLSDGFGTVQLDYDPTRPGHLATIGTFGTTVGWWGCATRSVTGGLVYTGSPPPFTCVNSPANFDIEVWYHLACVNSTGWRLWVYYPICSTTTTGGSSFPMDHPSYAGCQGTWPSDFLGGYILSHPTDLIVGTCNPLVVSWTKSVEPDPAHIYGPTISWTVTE